MEAEDVATVSVRFADGALGEIVATTSAAGESPSELRVIGDRGQVRISGGEVVVWDVPDRPRPAADAAADHVPGASGAPAGAAPPAPSATWGTTASGYIRQYRDFIAAVREHRPPFVTGEDGRDAVEVIVAAYESSRTGQTVVLERVPA